MSDGFWLSEAQVERLRPFVPKVRARVDDRWVLSGIIHVRRNGPMWKDAPWPQSSSAARRGLSLADEAVGPASSLRHHHAVPIVRVAAVAVRPLLTDVALHA